MSNEAIPTVSYADDAPAPNADPVAQAISTLGIKDPARIAFIHSIHGQESDNATGGNVPTSQTGAMGPMQIEPKTLQGILPGADPNNIYHTSLGGVKYAMEGYDKAKGDPRLAAAYYYGGPGGYDKLSKGQDFFPPAGVRGPAGSVYADTVAKRAAKFAASIPTVAYADDEPAQADYSNEGLTHPTPTVSPSTYDENYSHEGRNAPLTSQTPLAQPAAPKTALERTLAALRGPAPTQGIPASVLQDPVRGGTGPLNMAKDAANAVGRMAQGAGGTMDVMKAKIDAALPAVLSDTSSFPPQEQARIAQERADNQAKAKDFIQNKQGKLGMAGSLGEKLPGIAGATAAGLVSGGLVAPALGALGPLAGTAADALTFGAAGAGQKALEGGSASDIAGAGLVEGLGAGVSHAAGGLVQRGLSPFASEEGRMLQQATGDVTPGQLLGPRASMIEGQIGRKLPFSGITMARNSTEDKASRALVNEALGATGRVTPDVRSGFPTVERANQLVSNHYDTHLVNATMEPPATQAVIHDTTRAILDDPRLAGGAGQEIQDFVQGTIVPAQQHSESLGQGGFISGHDWKAIDSQMGRNAMAADGPVRDAWFDLQGRWREGLTGLTPEAKRGIQEGNDAFRSMIPINRAAASNVRNGGRFNAGDVGAAQLASRQGVSPLADAAIELSRQGTHHGDVLGTGALATAAALTHGASLPATLAGYTASNAAYSPWGRSIITRGFPGLRRLPLSLGRLAATTATAATQ